MRTKIFPSTTTLTFPISSGMTVAVSEFSSKIFATNVFGQLYIFNRKVVNLGSAKPPRISIQHVLPDRQLPLGGEFTTMAMIDCSRTAPKAYAKVSGQLIVMNTDTGEVTKTLPYPGLEFWRPRFSVDGSKVYVPFSNSIKVFSANNDTELAPIDVGAYFKNLLLSPDGKRLIAMGDHVAAIIETATGKVVSEHRTSFGDGWVSCISSDGKKVYIPTISDDGRSYIAVVDSSNLKEVGQIAGGGGGFMGDLFGGVASSPHHPFAVACDNHLMLIIDSRTDQVVDAISMSGGVELMDVAIDKYLVSYVNASDKFVAARFYG
ncbi:MAG TPA: YncE family protein [Dyella sp.]|uniref:YncE family protein n=1 Tax=Dyella sp. TaxID=1869338 RepID=UPI002F95FA02